ncbi:hypothetical protein NUM3379_13810 [Kineococcus sp. NUM-3379]
MSAVALSHPQPAVVLPRPGDLSRSVRRSVVAAAAGLPRPRAASPRPARRRPEVPAARASGCARGTAVAVRSAAPLRLTRRGRLALTCTAASLLVSAAASFVVLATSPAAASPEVVPAGTRQAEVVTVLPGETLSGIASRVRPGEDWRDVAAEIRRANGMSTSALAAGQQLRLPLGW